MADGKIEYKFLSEEKDGRKYLTLSGRVAKSSFWTGDDVISAKSITKELENTTVPITVYLNTQGGDVFEGIEIYNLFKNHQSDITVEITGLCASAGTFIALGADKVVMDTGTQFMIHQASTIAYGNKEDIQKSLNALESIDKSIISIYKAKTGKSEEELEDMLKKETWFDCEKALENGFIDEIKETVPKQKEEEKNNQSNIDIQNLADLIADELEKRNAGVQQKPAEKEEETKKISNFSKFMKGM